MGKIILGAIVYNEEHRFLQQFLDITKQYADELVLIDDGSTDRSLEICQKNTSHVFHTDRFFIKNERILRNVLWDKCVELCDNNSWIMIQDCDELMTNNSIQHVREEIEKAEKFNADGIAWNFYDMWSKTKYRSDNLWHVHNWPLVHTVKYIPDRAYMWVNKIFHCGRIPITSYYNAYCSNLQIKHMSYCTKELRKEKYDSYMEIDPYGKSGSLEQYKSILDKKPNLLRFIDNFK